MEPEGGKTPQEYENSYLLREAAGHIPSFEEQFDNVQRIETPDGKAIYRDLKPKEDNGESPIVTLLGFAVPAKYDKHVFNEFYNLNGHMVPIDVHHPGKSLASLAGSEIKRHARLVGQVIDQLPYEKLRVLSLSMDTLTLDELLKERPDLIPRIESVVTALPVGFGGGDNIVNFIKRQREETARWDNKQTPLDKEEGQKFVKFFNHQLIHHPIKSLKEIWSMGFANRYSLLNKLRQNNIPTAVLFGEEDALLSNERIMENVGAGYKSAFVEDENTPSGFTYDPSSKLSEEHRPPMEMIVKTGGGHEKMGTTEYAHKILRAFKGLKNPNRATESEID